MGHTAHCLAIQYNFPNLDSPNVIAILFILTETYSVFLDNLIVEQRPVCIQMFTGHTTGQEAQDHCIDLRADLATIPSADRGYSHINRGISILTKIIHY